MEKSRALLRGTWDAVDDLRGREDDALADGGSLVLDPRAMVFRSTAALELCETLQEAARRDL